MNRLIREQLNKISVANIPEFDDNTKEIFIPKFNQDKYIVGMYYTICLDDSLLIEDSSSVLASNWNNNSFPKSKYMKVEIIKTLGKMINVNGVGYDYINHTNMNYIWSGWLPVQQIKKIEVL